MAGSGTESDTAPESESDTVNFEQALDTLYRLVDYEKSATDKYTEPEYNLEGFRVLMQRLGNPQDRFRSVHITGSDGKGSVCEMLGRVFAAAGVTVGVYTSPHVSCVTERIAVNGAPIPKDEFARLVERVYPIALSPEVLSAGPRGYATVFEILTAIGWLYFAERDVEWAVVEVGLGGRLDATNILHPAACAITPICLEHTDRLGKTLPDIAREKAGIIKPGAPVVIGDQPPGVRAHFRKVCEERDAPLVVAAEAFPSVLDEMTPEGTRFRLLPPDSGEIALWMPAVGNHQIANAGVVAALTREITDRGALPCDWRTALAAGLERFRACCRAEVLPLDRERGLYAILDRGHTPQACAALRETLDALWPASERVFVLGCLKGKDPAGMARALLRQRDRVIATTPPGNPRALPAGELAPCLPPQTPVIPEAADAFRHAVSLVSAEGVVVVTGSIYMLDAIRTAAAEVASA